MENKMIRFVINFLVVFALQGCVSSPKATDDGTNAMPIKNIALKLQYIDADYQPIKNVLFPHKVTLEMPLIPGAVFGKVLTKPIISTVVSEGSYTTINLAAYEQTMAKYATPLLNTPFNAGLEIEPKATKLIRVGTFAYNAATGKGIGGTGLASASDDGSYQYQLILMYFDRPAVVSGVVLDCKTKIAIHVEAKQQGFIWIKAEKINSYTYAVSNESNDGNVLLTVHGIIKNKQQV